MVRPTPALFRWRRYYCFAERLWGNGLLGVDGVAFLGMGEGIKLIYVVRGDSLRAQNFSKFAVSVPPPTPGFVYAIP